MDIDNRNFTIIKIYLKRYNYTRVPRNIISLLIQYKNVKVIIVGTIVLYFNIK